MQSHTVLRIPFAHMVLSSHTHNSTANRARMISSTGEPVRFGQASDTAPQQRRPCVNSSQSPITTSPERPEDMPSSQPYVTMLLSLVLLVGLTSCGPASSDNAPTQESRANVTVPAARDVGQGGKPSGALGNGTGSLSRTQALQEGNNVRQGDSLPSRSDDTPTVDANGREKFPAAVLSDPIVKGLESPDAYVRLQTLDRVAKQRTIASLDPLIAALEDENEDVRTRATAILERYWENEKAQGRD